MPTTHALRDQRALHIATPGEPPALHTVDRVALRLGVALILWGQRHAERRRSADALRRQRQRVGSEIVATLERRVHAGTIW